MKGQTCWYVTCVCQSTQFEVDTGEDTIPCHVSTDACQYWIITSRLLRNIEDVYCDDCHRSLTAIKEDVDMDRIGVAV